MEQRDTSDDDFNDAPTRTRGMGQPQQPPTGTKKKLLTPKGCGCLGGAALLVVIIAAIAESSGSNGGSQAVSTSATGAGPSGYPSPYSTGGTDWASPTDDSYTDIPIYSAPADPETASVPEKVTYRCSGHAPDGVDITYGPEGSNYSASHLPFTKTATLDDSAQYYAIQGQLSGAGSVTCTVTVQTSDGTVVTQSGSASGGYNIASAEICSSFDGSWDKC